MAKKPRPGMRAHPSTRSGDSVASGYSTRSGLSGKSGHGNRRVSTRPSIRRADSNSSGLSNGGGLDSTHGGRRAKMKKSGSFASLGSAIGEGLVKATKAPKKVRPGMRTAPSMGIHNVSTGSGLTSTSGHVRRGSGLTRQGSGLRRQGSGLRRQGSGLQRQGSGLRRQGSGLQRQGSGLSSTRSRSPAVADQEQAIETTSRRGVKRQNSRDSIKRDSIARDSIARDTTRTTSTFGGSTSGGGGTMKRQNSGLDGPSRHSMRRQNSGLDAYSRHSSGYGSEYEEDIEAPRVQSAEEVRQGLMTERVTKGFFRKKTRSIRWYSADIDKIDKGEYEGKEHADDSSSGEYELEEESLDDDDPANQQQEVWWKRLLRGLLLLEKKGEEVTPIKRWVRALTWLTFLCDFTAALVTLIQFDEVAQCCDRDILNFGAININWALIIQISVVGYLILILLEVYPVIRRGFPFNIVNPLIGFMMTFALFFDDSYMEALIMWGIETCAVLCEFAMYRVKIRQVNLRQEEIKKLMPKTTAKKKPTEDEDKYLRDLHKARRRYYVLKQEQRMDRQLLQYLHVAVYMNIIMASIVLILILVIARNGGLCIAQFDYPNPFDPNQIGKCFLCNSTTDECQICDAENNVYQCYFPYS